MGKVSRITSKGQVTIPVAIRKKLDCQAVEFVEKDGLIIIYPVQNLAGILGEYALSKSVSFPKERAMAWRKRVRELHENS